VTPDQRPTPVTVAANAPTQSAPITSARRVQEVQTETGVKEAPTQASIEQLQRISDDLQRRVSGVAPELQFSVDQGSGRSMIKVTDRLTSEVIRQIPSEEALQINKGLDRFQQGLLLNRKA